MTVHAHFYDRRANALLKKYCFDEAIDYHLSAAKFLTESLKATDNEKAKQSIQLQKEYHLKQKDVLRVKKIQYQSLKEVLRVHKEAISRMMKARNGKNDDSESEENSLQKVIYRTIEEADSLLDILVHKEDANHSDKELTSNGSSGDAAYSVGTVHPKDDKTVIEELKIVNYQLSYK
ncbi:Nuclear receptor-binding factor, putative [Pediculus humanus corporis]|uniref:Nuclear receptor-binding factor, putative n=1 Tax=Pediculus humanus subsp. corporis TaxID=121224 RepID=E0VJ76_PEDHC|nr:Nuclear receptor-binding factor, putative [Pediculus humanus corporis]EEB13432.1 Nuclear receptor-binding factor, putative [Pediculus humanus corporis]